MNKQKQQKNKQRGITLIALVVTIIVLIILAGVSINMLIGDNGIITQSQTAKSKTEIKGEEEKIRLAINTAQIENNGNSNIEKDDLEIALLENGTKSIVVDNEDDTNSIICLDSKKIYKLKNDGSIEDTNSDFDSIYVAPDSQDEARNEGVIGIGADGNPVDMDLWEYTLLEDGTYGLNDENSIKDIGKNKGYLGEYANGEIVGAIPQYISIDNGKNYIPVTNMFATFCEVSELTIMPVIPSTVEVLTNSFIRCNNLIELKEIPSGVEETGSMFKGCTSITKAIEIPNGVKNMLGMFSGCINLQVPPTEIPSSVENMHTAFLDCVKLEGEIAINANVTGAIINGKEEDFYRCFYGACLKENNVLLKLYLKEDIYDLFNNNTNILYSDVSNIELIEQ